MNVNIASSSPKHVYRDTPSDRQVSQRVVSVNPSPQLTDLHDDVLYQLCRYLPLNETNVLARSCKRLDQVIDKGFLSYEGRTWFARFGPEQQNQFRAIAKTNNDDDLKAWLTTPGKDQAIIEQLIRRRKRNDLFTEVLSYTSSRLTAETNRFEAFSLLRVIFSGFSLDWMDFNTDGRYAVAMVHSLERFNRRAMAIIYCACHSPDAKGGWVEQLAIPCQESLRRLLVFSPDGQHMVAACVDNKIVIYRLEPESSRGMDKLWRKLTTISQPDEIAQITFNANGQYLATLCDNGFTTISALGSEGEWLKEAVISLNVPVIWVTFADNGHRVLLSLQNESGKTYDRNAGGDWVEQIDFKQCARVFSGDGCHVITYSIDGKTSICSRGADGTWPNGIVIDDQGQNTSAHFSPDSKFLLIYQQETIKIFGIDNQGRWAEQAVCDLVARSIMSAKFSNDSRHVLIDYEDDGYHATIISREKSNTWRTTAIFYHVVSVAFSCDARLVVVRGIGLKTNRTDNVDRVDLSESDEDEVDETGSLQSSDESDSEEEQGFKSSVLDLSGNACFSEPPGVSLKIYGWKASREWRERTIVFRTGANKNLGLAPFCLSSDNRHLLTTDLHTVQLWRLEPQSGKYRKKPMGWQGGARTIRMLSRSRTLPAE